MSKKTIRLLTLLSIIAVIGIGISIALTQHFYELRNGGAGFKSYCNISEKINCDVVAASPYAEFLWGIPISSFAAGWFLAALIFSLVARSPQWRGETLRMLLGMHGFGTVLSLAYLFIMVGVIKTLCLLCLVTDAVTLASLGIVISLRPEKLKMKKFDSGLWKMFLVLLVGSLLVSVTLLRAFDNLASDGRIIDETADSILNTSAVQIKQPAHSPVMGSETAPVTIVEFSDFQCPFCRMGAIILNSVINRYPGKVKVVFRNFPLDAACNSSIDRTMHPAACEAAFTSICANAQGKFEEYYKEVFDKQSSLAPGVPEKLAEKVGVDEGKLNQCISNTNTELAVAEDVAEGVLLGVKSTPTFFINGRKVEGAQALPVWSKVIERLLKQP